MLSLPPTVAYTEENFSDILAAMLNGTMTVWGLRIEDMWKAICVTTVSFDGVTRQKNLFMFSLYAVDGGIQDEVWLGAMLHLKRYAKKVGCTQITSTTTNPRLVDLAKKMNGNTNYTIVVFNVEDE